MKKLIQTHVALIKKVADKIAFINGYHEYMRNGLNNVNKNNSSFFQFGFAKAQIDFSKGKK